MKLFRANGYPRPIFVTGGGQDFVPACTLSRRTASHPARKWWAAGGQRRVLVTTRSGKPILTKVAKLLLER